MLPTPVLPTPVLPTCSRADLPAELYELMAAMTREGRTIPAQAMATDQHGCTILGAWVKRRLDQAAGMQQGGLGWKGHMVGWVMVSAAETKTQPETVLYCCCCHHCL